MSFCFFKARLRTPQEVAKATKDSLVVLDSITVVDFEAREKALGEVEKNFSTISSYNNKDVVSTGGNMLRECIKFQTLAKLSTFSACDSLPVVFPAVISSPQLFFKYIALPNFDVSCNAFSIFKALLTRHTEEVAEYLTFHFDEFFAIYEQLLTSSKCVTRGQSLKLLSYILFEPLNMPVMKRYSLEIRYLKVIMTLLKVFVANPNKPREIKIILAKNCAKLLDLLRGLSMGKGSDDDLFEEKKELVMKEIENAYRLYNYNR
ncbi:hypothetical protein Cgig2_024929 [Carnegiea gigantea]|uniref:MO25-like protein n=1 Tax=Carnegiea gigantea TaxID=171969 RepID=A0A9Q1KCW4_9CARY|nr:hypothetical protein Cgig2_024929 [Carnegiea gigantea]